MMVIPEKKVVILSLLRLKALLLVKPM